MVDEAEPHEQSEWTKVFQQQVAEEQRAVEALPFVKSIRFTYGDTANANKVFATVWCCWDQARQSFKQVAMACDLEHRPTHLDALLALREKLVREHGGGDHVHHPKAEARRVELRGETAHSDNAFDVLKAAASAQCMARQRADADTRALDLAFKAEMEATKAREAAELRARASAATVSAMAPQRASKKQKTVDTSTAAPEAVTDEPSSTEDWPLWIWRREESRSQHRRAVEIDPANTDTALPPKGECGWRRHPRRGLIGAVQDWAEGSKLRVAFMLAALAQHFDVVDAVAERLGLRLSKEKVAEAKTDSYIVERVRDALHQLKQCRSVAESTDYSVVLAAVAPQRATAGDQEGMMKKVFARLGVQRGSRYVKASGERRERAPDQAVTRRAAFDKHLRSGINRGVAQRAREMIRGIVCRKQPVPALPPARLWEISTGSERRILDLCCC